MLNVGVLAWGLSSADSPEWVWSEVLAGANLACAGLWAGGLNVVRDLVRPAPDVLMVDAAEPDSALFDWLQAQGTDGQLPWPVVLFTRSTDAGVLARSVEVGVHVHSLWGLSADRLPACAALAVARHRRETARHQAHLALQQQLDERKVVDRAKGLLMQSQNMSDEQAFSLLRRVSMNASVRLGQLARHVVDSAQHAEAVNRAGQLRMLSQRLVSLHCLYPHVARRAPLAQAMDAALERAAANLVFLQRGLDATGYGPALQQVQAAWEALAAGCARVRPERGGRGPRARSADPPAGHPVEDVLVLDRLAEALLEAADTLAVHLQRESGGEPLHLLNTVGRQRMWCQRYVKLVLLQGVAGAAASHLSDTRQAVRTRFEAALVELNRMPLTNQAIESTLAQAGAHWVALRHSGEKLAAAVSREPAGALLALLQAGDELLGDFETLATHYETSLQVLIG